MLTSFCLLKNDQTYNFTYPARFQPYCVILNSVGYNSTPVLCLNSHFDKFWLVVKVNLQRGNYVNGNKDNLCVSNTYAFNICTFAPILIARLTRSSATSMQTSSLDLLSCNLILGIDVPLQDYVGGNITSKAIHVGISTSLETATVNMYCHISLNSTWSLTKKLLNTYNLLILKQSFLHLFHIARYNGPGLIWWSGSVLHYYPQLHLYNVQHLFNS